RLDVDSGICGLLAQTGHQLDIAGQGHDEARTSGRIYVAHWQREAARAAFQRGVVREGEVGLRHAHWQRSHPALGQPVDALLALWEKLDVRGSVDAPSQRLNLLANRRIGRVQGREV